MNQAPPSTAGRPLPHDLEAELGIAATLFAYPSRWFDVSWLPALDFFDPRTGFVYAAIGAVAEAESAVDAVTVRAHLESRGEWERVGMQHLERILRDGVISEPLLDKLTEIVADRAAVRRAILACQGIMNEGYSPLENPRAWADALPGRIEQAVRCEAAKTGRSAKAVMVEMFAEWQGTTRPQLLGTGLPELDVILRKMRPGQLIVVAAHSGVGKSAFAACVATHTACYERFEDREYASRVYGWTGADDETLPDELWQRAGVYIQSAEMSDREYIERMVFSHARVNTTKTNEDKRGTIRDEEWQKVTASAAALAVDHIYIDDRSDITIARIRTEVRRVKARFAREGHPLRLVILDYAQIIGSDDEGNGRKNDNREQEVARVARGAKKLAKSEKITVILLAQLNEDSVREKRRPRAGDVRESRSLKQEADKFILIFNPYYVERSAAYRRGEAKQQSLGVEHVELIVDKNRGAPTGIVLASFYPSFTLFVPFEGEETEVQNYVEEFLKNGQKAGKRS